MAFGAAKETVDSTPIKRYIGVAPVFVSAVNPTKAELERIYDITLDSEPNYLGESEIEVGGVRKSVDQVRLDIVVKTDSDACGVDMKTKISFFLKNAVRYNRDGSKVQMINQYGETTWLTKEDAKNKIIPNNLSWFDGSNMRPAYIGEEELIGFIKTYLNIPNKSYKNKTTGEIVEIPNKADAEARLDSIDKYFKGDFSELKSILSIMPNNKIKVLFGVKSTDDGKQYQAVYTQKFLKPNVTLYTAIESDLEKRKALGSYPNVEFKMCDIQEYIVEATRFEEVKDDLPSGVDDNPWNM